MGNEQSSSDNGNVMMVSVRNGNVQFQSINQDQMQFLMLMATNLTQRINNHSCDCPKCKKKRMMQEKINEIKKNKLKPFQLFNFFIIINLNIIHSSYCFLALKWNLHSICFFITAIFCFITCFLACFLAAVFAF